MKHRWYLDKDGEVDEWRLEADIHNGPECTRCGESFCMDCEPDWWHQECPVRWEQMELF